MSISRKEAWPGRSYVSTFVHVLHLLDLDLIEDWPGVTLATFGSKSTLQHRTRCIEWSLYRLFELYDHRTCAIKLKPFFPPSTPLQSKNLRAALLRQLTDLKTNGALGPNIVIRRTMLDECKGEKFDELVAAFSMLVLRKVSSLQTNSVALPEPQHVVPLILAHRVVLQANLNKRRSVRQKATALQNSTRQTLKALDRRKQELEAVRIELDPCDVAEVEQKLFGNWIGDNRLANEILHGGTDEFQDATSISMSPNISDEKPSSSLHPDFDTALHKAQSHLHDLQEALHMLSKTIGPVPMKETFSLSEPMPAFNLARRERLVGNDAQSVSIDKTMAEEHTSILESLEKDLGALANLKPSLKEHLPPRSATGDMYLPAPHHTHQVDHVISQPRNSTHIAVRGSTASFSANSLPKSLHPASNLSTHMVSSSPWVPEISRKLEEQPQEDDIYQNKLLHSSERLQSSSNRSTAFMAPAMIQGVKEKLPDDSPSASGLPSSPPALELPLTTTSHNSSTLLERTRNSISALSRAASTPNKHKKTKSAATVSVSNWTTSRRRSSLQSSCIAEPDVSTLQEELLEGDADYASVFKSRPKLALSPSLSPQKW